MEALTECLIPELKQPSIIILDNATFHRARSSMRIIHQAGHRILFLPPYSPHLNLIEKPWANIKRAWQYKHDKTIDQIIKEVNYGYHYSIKQAEEGISRKIAVRRICLQY